MSVPPPGGNGHDQAWIRLGRIGVVAPARQRRVTTATMPSTAACKARESGRKFICCLLLVALKRVLMRGRKPRPLEARLVRRNVSTHTMLFRENETHCIMSNPTQSAQKSGRRRSLPSPAHRSCSRPALRIGIFRWLNSAGAAACTKTTVLRLARTPAWSGYMVQREDGEWRLGPSRAGLGARYQAGFDVLERAGARCASSDSAASAAALARARAIAAYLPGIAWKRPQAWPPPRAHGRGCHWTRARRAASSRVLGRAWRDPRADLAKGLPLLHRRARAARWWRRSRRRCSACTGGSWGRSASPGPAVATARGQARSPGPDRDRRSRTSCPMRWPATPPHRPPALCATTQWIPEGRKPAPKGFILSE